MLVYKQEKVLVYRQDYKRVLERAYDLACVNKRVFLMDDKA